ncbi:MAG: LamB/YcsF family protein [Paracoccaceae bacterium]|nr:LamB/YcsF family protein [Paracoccaceae bacterium]
MIYQIVAIRGMCAVEGHTMTQVKTHGALGNMSAVDPDLAALCARPVRAVDPDLVCVSLPYSETYVAAEKLGLRMACEIYADRSYTEAEKLIPRSLPGAAIHDPKRSLVKLLRW